MSSYFIESLGCPKNLVDSEVFAAIFERAGFEPAPEPAGADIVLLNTCSFLAEALAELDQVLATLAELKADGGIGELLVTGCVMNRGRKDFQDAYPEVDAWLPLKEFSALENRLKLPTASLRERAPLTFGFHRYLRISDGCNNRCSYCTIPSIRGDLHSVPLEDLVREAQALAADSEETPLELIVIAQDTASYGLDLYGRKALPELLEKLHAIPVFQWIRVMYLHPDNFETAWLPLFQRLPKLLPSFEIPIQHSEDRILKAMRRRKGRDLLQGLFGQIRRELPQAALRTTLISGFPGETRQDALALQSFIREVGFLHLGVFIFSPEPDTLAENLPGAVPNRTARSRRDRLIEMQSDITESLLQQYVGQTVEVLIEDEAEVKDGEGYVGRAWFQAPDIDGVTYLEPGDCQPGEIREVIIDDVIGTDLFGRVMKRKNKP